MGGEPEFAWEGLELALRRIKRKRKAYYAGMALCAALLAVGLILSYYQYSIIYTPAFDAYTAVGAAVLAVSSLGVMVSLACELGDLKRAEWSAYELARELGEI